MSRSKDSTSLGIVYSDPLALWALDFLIRRQHAPLDIIWTYSSGKEVLQNIDNFEHPQAMLIDLDLLDINYSILSRRIKLIDSNIGTVGIASSLPQESLEARNTSQINLIVIFIIAALQVPAYAMHDRNARWSVSHLHCVLSGCFSDLPDFAGSCHNGVLWQRRNTLRRPENLGNPHK